MNVHVLVCAYLWNTYCTSKSYTYEGYKDFGEETPQPVDSTCSLRQVVKRTGKLPSSFACSVRVGDLGYPACAKNGLPECEV